MTVAVSGALRVERAFARARAEKRLALVVYLTHGLHQSVGEPRRSSSAALLHAALDGGADVLEIGVPFSDPLADGTTVQRASETALRNGVTLADCLSEAGAIVDQRDAAVLLMGYTNPFMQYGFERLAADGARAGLAGVIVPDMPAEESAELDRAFGPAGLLRIDLYAPTTPDERLVKLLPRSRGFVYCVSLTGVTGARRALPADVAEFVGRVRRHTTLPIVVGFGISTPEHASALRGIADGIVVGSAAVDVVTSTAPERRAETLRDFVGSLAAAGRS
ncbi:MAG TPA: tryptophan synthase subunit alpha [Candidatus Limnocylindria bacterium]|nr:tryptophan synthase subunit alpha [Candidatus Limnocylindria bacterium]